MPEVGVEPTRPKGPRDFESRASANSATLARTAWEIIRSRRDGVKHGIPALNVIPITYSSDVSVYTAFGWSMLAKLDVMSVTYRFRYVNYVRLFDLSRDG